MAGEKLKVQFWSKEYLLFWNRKIEMKIKLKILEKWILINETSKNKRLKNCRRFHDFVTQNEASQFHSWNLIKTAEHLVKVKLLTYQPQMYWPWGPRSRPKHVNKETTIQEGSQWSRAATQHLLEVDCLLLWREGLGRCSEGTLLKGSLWVFG